MTHLLLAVIYLAFISLGLPDALLGGAWPVIYQQWDVPVSWAGIVYMIISLGTVVSSLMSDRLTRALGAGKVTALSVAATAAALWGYSVSGSFWQLCLWSIPYGLGAGSVDAALNNYVALHYDSHHMSWLHCMWGIGASVGPHIMSRALVGAQGWSGGYQTVALIQTVLTLLLFCSLYLWKGQKLPAEAQSGNALSLRQVLDIPGVKRAIAAFFCYSAMETTVFLWGASYLVLCRAFPEAEAARLGGLFYLGMTVGRALAGFVTMRLNDQQMIRLGQALTMVGIAILLLPLGAAGAAAGMLVIGLGCAPIYPCFIHATPAYFGPDRSQAVIGVQMAGAYVATSFMPPLFGLVAQYISPALFPVYLLAFLLAMVVLHEGMIRQKK